MTEPRRQSVLCASPSGLHRLAYVEWGDPANDRVLLCAHGLTRTGRDFDYLARALCDRYRVVCPDFPGRGDSDWLKSPTEYVVPVYVADMVTLIARLDVASVDWVGTSMGGMVGMGLASLDHNPIGKLVLNDVGPVLAGEALTRIAAYVGKAPPFPTFEAAEAVVRMVSASFGPHTQEQWRFLAENVIRPAPDGTWRLHYDPDIAVPFKAEATGKDVSFWPVYDAIHCPTLVLRGAQSDLLSPGVAKQMTGRGPKAALVELPGIGHAPTLIHEEQIARVRDFLLG